MGSDQRLTEIELIDIDVRYPRTIGRNARLGSHGAGFPARVARVSTNTGASGWGVVEGRAGELQQWVGYPLEELFEPSVGLLDPAAAPLDLALHDLAARAAAVPVFALLGGRGERSVPCYSGAIYFDDLDPEDAPRGVSAVLENCAADWSSGYRAFKLKIGRGNRWMDRQAGFVRDVEVTRAVREHYPDARLLVDVNDGYTPGETIAFLRAVADCDLYWIEEPFQEEAAGLLAVRDYLRESGSRVLIADGEWQPEEDSLLELARSGLIDVLLMDVLTFGLTAWRRVMPQLAQMGVAASPHAWGQPLKTAYAAQLATGLGNVEVVEGVPGGTGGVDASAYRLDGGSIVVPDQPGFGLTLTG
ncbi:enolase C-terminal domain-like protein [Ruania rhizosphaerae]|uniref:enolase C-terminal domain-like protein n=1 Tax=Ruania rhizosphaerae TaxID=1840413 RepID=UPI00135C6A31|nr:enolase C-terminal domain-like protein [Ruania rhizosphaerae]